MKKKENNYQTLHERLFELYDNIEKGIVDIEKAKVMVKTASTTIANQKAKLLSLKLTSEEKRVRFYEDLENN
jgi:hypothetical protein